MQRRFVLASVLLLTLAAASVTGSIWLATRANAWLIPARALFLLSGVLSLTAAVLGISGSSDPLWRSPGIWLFLASSALFALFLHALVGQTLPL